MAMPNRTSMRHLWPAILVAYACILPRELALDVGGAALFPYRLVLILLAPYAITQIASQKLQRSFVDVLAAIAAGWYILALFASTSPVAAGITGVSLAIDFGFAYLIGRTCLRSAEDFRLFFIALLPGLLVVSAIMAVESFTHNIFLRPLIADLMGQGAPNIQPRERWGIIRSVGPFPHPILGGVFLAVMLPLAIYLTKTLKQRALGLLVAFSSFLVVSSTAILALAMCGAFLGAFWLQRTIKLPVFTTVAVFGTMIFLVIATLSESGPVSFFIRTMTVDAGSGYYRQLIWEYAGREIDEFPMFGIGTRDWRRPWWMGASVDSYWLVTALRYGMPAMLASLFTMVGTIALLLIKLPKMTEGAKVVAAALAMTISAIVFSGLSVHIWEGLHTWLLLVCGGSISFASASVDVRKSGRWYRLRPAKPGEIPKGEPLRLLRRRQ